jgi:RecA-family ATPase
MSSQVLTVEEILAHDSGDTSMLIEGHLPATGAVLLVGTAKSGKTILAVQMAIAVASGEPLYGRYRVSTPGAVLLVEQDDPAGVSSVKAMLQRSQLPTAGIPFYLATDSPQFGSAFITWLEGHITELSLRLVVLDSYTALRGPRPKGVDIVKAEQSDLRQLDALAKRARCVILVITHSSKGSAGLDWSEKAAGTFAMGAATESQIHVSRFPELDNSAAERLVRIRGRHSEDLELVLRFRKENLDYAFALEGGAASFYPTLLQLQTAFGRESFGPKQISRATGCSPATAHRLIDRLTQAGALQKRSYGEYFLAEALKAEIRGRCERPDAL